MGVIASPLDRLVVIGRCSGCRHYTCRLNFRQCSLKCAERSLKAFKCRLAWQLRCQTARESARNRAVTFVQFSLIASYRIMLEATTYDDPMVLDLEI